MKNSKIILIIALILVVLSGVLFFVLGGSDDPRTAVNAPRSTSASDTASEPVQSSETTEAVNSNGYQDYDTKTVAETDGKKILFFHASWCPTCKALDQNIRAGVIPADLTIFKVNYDTADELRQKHGVTYQHTLVQVGDNGEQLNKWFGSYTIDQLVDEAI